MQNNSTTIMCPFCGSDTLVILDGEEGEFDGVRLRELLPTNLGECQG